MSDSMMEILELIENNKHKMKSSVYLNLVNGLQDLYKKTNGTFTTDYRQMYMDLQKKANEFFGLASGKSDIHWVYDNGVGYGFTWLDNNWYTRCIERYFDGEGYQRQEFASNGKLSRILKLNKERKIHCADGPAVKRYDEHENVLAEDWYEHGVRTQIKWYLDGYVKLEAVFEKPTLMYQRFYRKNDKLGIFLSEEIWVKDGELDRDNHHFPAYVKYSEQTGLKELEEFYNMGLKISTIYYCPITGKKISKIDEYELPEWLFAEH